MTIRYDGKVAIVTGSSKGIGRAAAECMAAIGAKVVVSSRNVESCNDVADAIRSKGGEAIAVAANIGLKLPGYAMCRASQMAFM